MSSSRRRRLSCTGVRPHPPRALRDRLALARRSGDRIGIVSVRLDPQLLVHAPLGLTQPLGAFTGDRRALGGALVIQPALGVFEPLLAAGMRRDLRRQLVAAAITEALVLFNVDRGRPRSPRGPGVVVELASRLALAALLPSMATMFNRSGRPRAQPRTSPKIAQRVLVALDEPRDRRVIGLALRRDHAIRDVLHARALDRPRATGSRARRRRGSTRPSSPDQTLAGCAHRLDRRHKTLPAPSTRRPRARTTRSGLPASHSRTWHPTDGSTYNLGDNLDQPGR